MLPLCTSAIVSLGGIFRHASLLESVRVVGLGVVDVHYSPVIRL